MTPIKIEISPGELWDRITILQLKQGRIKDKAKLTAVARQLTTILAVFTPLTWPIEIWNMVKDLEETNARLWDIEDRLRAADAKVFPLEQYGNMDCLPQGLEAFLEDARAVYVTNTRRSELKAAIDEACGYVPEVKEYSEFQE